MDYPFNRLTHSIENSYSLENDYSLTLVFVDSNTLDFTINDTVFDPCV